VVAEDDVLTRMLVKVLLEREGCTLLEARTGREAIEVAARERPLSGADGSADGRDERLRRDRAAAAGDALASTPVLVISSDDRPSCESQRARAHADDYLAKP
jgi:CheY-like chemotaxis protein